MRFIRTMNRLSVNNIRLTIAALVCACFMPLPCAHAQIAIDSFDGPVTQNEINSFKSYILTLKPATWDGSSGNTTTNMANEYAQGHSGENIKAMGLMYEITGDTAILDRMIYFCDVLLSQRNDILPAPYGQRTVWTGRIDPVWPGNTTDPASADGANGDEVGHLGNCARLILQTPAIWNTTVAIGDPFGHGATYLARAKTFVSQGDFSFDQFFFPSLLDLSDQNHLKYSTASPYQPGNQLPWNQEMMITYPLQNLAAAHSILGDDPTRVAKYDNIVQVNISRFFNDPAVRLIYTDSKGNTAYNWAYTPFYQTGEDSNHGSLDIAGFSRAYTSGRYGITADMMTPFANTFVDVMILGPQNYAGTVGGACGSGHAACTTYIRSGYLLLAEFRPDAYQSMMAADFTAPGTTTSMDGFSRFEWVKNRRAQGSGDFSLSASPSSQTVTAGGSTSYTASVSPSNGFNSSVNLSVSGVPSGATGSFTPASISGGSGSSTLSVGTSSSMAAGTYTLTATGTSGSLSHSATVTLVVNPPPDFSLSASPSSQSVIAGSSTSYTATVGALNGFNGSVSLTVSGLPTGATGGFTPASVSGSGNSTLSVSTTASTAAGTYPLTVTGTSGGLSHSTTVALTVSLPQVTAPVFNPAGGSYTAAQSVTISTTTSGASIRYTTDGSTPSETAGTLYSGPVAIGSTTTLKAIAYESGMSDSAVSSATYTISLPQVAAPTFSPVGGNYSAAQSVTISTTTSGASIRYTTDGSTPSETAGTLYSGPVTVSSTATLQAIAYESGMVDSPVSSATYTITITGLPNGWTDSDIGSPSLAGSATFSNNTFTIKGSGADIYGTSDQFNYAYVSTNGDMTVTAHVASQTNTNGWAKSGVMIRETTAANAAYVGIYVTPSNGVDMQYRSATGVSATDLARASGIVAPYWVRLVRSGNTFTGYRSADGVTWTQVGSISVSMASSVNPGLAVCSHTTTALSSATFDNVSVSTPLPPAAAPTFNPAGGTYTAAQSVTIATTTSGASIRYTTDGSTPSETAGTLYSGPVTVGSTTTLKAIAYESGMADSSVSSATYTINLPQVAAPAFSPAGGTYSTAQSVTISSTTSGASIRYTTDGSTPSETAGALYSGPVTVSSTTTLKAIAYESGMADSSVSSATYTISLPQVATPTFSPGSGSYTTAQSVAISTTTSGASIRYTTNGTTPSETAGTLYSGPVSVSSTTTVKAIAYESGMADSAVASATYSFGPGPLAIAATSESGDDGGGHTVAMTIDGNFSTYWQSTTNGTSTAFVQYDLGANHSVSSVKIAWFLGNTRSTWFDVLTSTDGTNWTTVVNGANSSGTTTAFETYSFTAVTARYVRYVCHGTSIDNVNAIAETQIIGQ